MQEHLFSDAQNDNPLWLDTLRARFATDPNAVRLTLRRIGADGSIRDFPLPLPRPQTPEQRETLRRYLCATVYNLLSALSAQRLEFYLDPSETQAHELLNELPALFQLGADEHSGYGKVTAIADRLCRALGKPPLEFAVCDAADYHPIPSEMAKPTAVLPEKLSACLAKAVHGIVCGMDIGGTDIKLAISRDGMLLCCKEFDWNPAAYPNVEDLIRPIMLLLRLMACRAAVQNPASTLLCALEKGATLAEMQAVVDTLPTVRFDALGISFPDVVISDRIVGGETPKTRAMRQNTSRNYEAQFAELRELRELLKPLCRENAPIRIINDGHMAAFAAALELCAGGQSTLLADGVIAHALGTDLGTGWLDPDGSIPQVPMELYDFLLDLGSAHSADLAPDDLRSVRNENSGMAGARRYVGQAAAFRLAWTSDPHLLDGFTEVRDGLLLLPAQLRKPCLEHLMQAAQDGSKAARAVFLDIGRNLGHVCLEAEWLLAPKTHFRFLFGRFVKLPACFTLLAQGLAEICPDLVLRAPDESMANSPLMAQLAAQHGPTVAQFGQAIASIYYALM